MERDRYKELEQELNLAVITLVCLAASIYLIRLGVADAHRAYELERRRAAKAENDLDGALAHIHELANGDDKPAA